MCLSGRRAERLSESGLAELEIVTPTYIAQCRQRDTQHHPVLGLRQALRSMLDVGYINQGQMYEYQSAYSDLDVAQQAKLRDAFATAATAVYAAYDI